jgi:hypothetical protein
VHVDNQTAHNFLKLLGRCFSPEPCKGLKDVSSFQMSLPATEVCAAGYMLPDVAREMRVCQTCHKTISRGSHLSTEPLWLQVKKKTQKYVSLRKSKGTNSRHNCYILYYTLFDARIPGWSTKAHFD